MSGILLSSAVLLTIVVCSHSASLPVAVTQAGQCVYQGKTYVVGEKTDSDCQPCECTSSGRMACLVIDCFFPAPCVDAVHIKGHCCSSCPNGPNCQHGTHIIKKGEVYNPDPHTACICPTAFGFGFGTHAHEANCTKIA